MSFFGPDDDPFDGIEEFYFGGVDMVKIHKNEMIYNIINGIRKYKEITQH